MSLVDIRARTLFCVLAGYIILNYAFMQLRVVIPLGDIGLILCLTTINIPVVLKKMSGSISLTPFLIWWCFGLGRAIVDGVEYGIWALRDAAQVIESLWLIVAFVVARKAYDIDKLFQWLKWLFIAYCVYALGAPFADGIAAISPSIPQAANGDPVPVVGTYANLSLMLFWIAFYLTIPEHKNQCVRIAALAIACMMIAAVVVVLQSRTNYLQLAALTCIVGLFRPKSFGRFGMVIPIMFIAVGTMTAFDVRIPGRLTENISFSFYIQHLEAVVGISEGDHQGVASAASGVPLRLDWWTKMLEQEAADPVTLITGLGYGRPLTNYVASNDVGPGGLSVREPHNSFLSVLGRMGVVGAISWIWLHVELFRQWHKVFAYCRRLKDEVWINRMLLMLAFVALILVSTVGEDVLEKSFNIVPYYCFWGIVLRMGVNIAMKRQPILAEGRYYTAA
jgi:O-antigen ligase/polysaccharide polymerase Wzy-like membrane protein